MYAGAIDDLTLYYEVGNRRGAHAPLSALVSSSEFRGARHRGAELDESADSGRP